MNSTKNNTREDLSILRHSCAHIMASAVKALYPAVKIAIGPSTADGFYYDFDREDPFTPEDLERITDKMKEIIQQDLPFERQEKKKDKVIQFFQEKGEVYKVELLHEIPDEDVSLYQTGDFIDLCRGPHVKSSGRVKHFKLLEVAAAYWRGDEKRGISLQRIYGTAFHTDQELQDYLSLLEEAKKRDHRKLGRELDLYSVHQEAGAGLIFWHPKGARIRKVIEDFWEEEHLKNGYHLVNIPHISKVDLWKTSGHWDFYREQMYSPMEIENQDYIVKPMNCPGHILIYQTKLHSYRDLPLRWAEMGTVYRYERSGVLHGLMRVRGFTQDDAHIFCRADQLEEEIDRVIAFVLFMLKTFGFKEYEIFLSTRPDKYVGTQENWERAEESLKRTLKKEKLSYHVDPGGGVFYGPKADIKIKDSLGRAWQCSTIQVDFNLPEKFNITYIGDKGDEQRPIMIHRALLGSLERFFGVLIEHYGGAFPLWLAPVQARVMTITDAGVPYAREVEKRVFSEGIRIDNDYRNEKINKKIRDAQIEKIPYMLIIGKKECETGTISVRSREKGDIGTHSLDNIIQRIARENEAKTSETKRILVADDDPDILRLVREALGREGFHVLTATNGKAAQEIAFRERPDLIILDVEMPGEDGYQVTRNLRSNEKTMTVPIIILTVRRKFWERLEGFMSGSYDYITKPFELENLIARAKELLTMSEKQTEGKREE